MTKTSTPILIDDLDADVEAIDQVMLRLSWAARKQLAQELDQFNLTIPQYVTLRSLGSTSQGCTMRELAEAAQQLSPTMTGIVDRLLEAGLVRRQIDSQDRRALRVFLTDKGRQLMDALEKKRRIRLTQVVGALEAQERKELIRLLERYTAASLTIS
jgi:DNA-binding MarR family transcriptional regulator